MPWADAILATDDDLSRWESRMPALALQVQAINGNTAYDGKRALAKDRIGSILRNRSMILDGIQDPTQLTSAAALLELSFIFQDMAWRDDALSADKARYYYDLFEQEMNNLYLDYVEPAINGPSTGTRAYKGVPVERG